MKSAPQGMGPASPCPVPPADQLKNPFIRAAFGVAQSCHSNFYNDWMEQEDLDGYLPDIETLVNITLSSKST